MTLHVDDPGFLALRSASARHPLARPEAVAQRDREHVAAGRLPTVEERERAMLAAADVIANLPVLDDRSPEEILGYDESGLPT
ncbi:type II toxin-antitoxin system VapB family antitoxin [Conexibacter arvalis]|uniref:Antitoxin VapB n=1 Tax=Conexibacter arvalis TaxID=912552 RepID=A0A840I8W0_9ACTN|nr:type II toxin-antitoxin system VapB family antitoxin [Conexibacter arvalis]MBB4660755.1 hypothetical protein [Conexibacter arvalis]